MRLPLTLATVQDNPTMHKPPPEKRQEGRSGARLGLYPRSRVLSKAALSGLANKGEQCGVGLSAQPRYIL